MRIYLVTANAQDHNEYIEYRDQPYNPDSFTDTPMHMGEYYDYFGLPNILEALGKWDKQYGMDNETTGR